MKTCPKCQTLKPLDDFAACKRTADGLQVTCRACQAAYYQAHKEHILARIEADHQARPEVYKARAHEFYTKHVEQITAQVKRYRATPKGREVSYAITRRQIDKYPERTRAHSAVRYALQTGRLIRQPCEVCGATYRVQAHHDSYAQEHRLDVRWLCPKHHKQIHTNDI